MNETFEKVAQILSVHKGIDKAEIKPESELSSLELDSLDVVELIMQFEEEFDCTLEVQDNLKNVQDFVKIIEQELNK